MRSRKSNPSDRPCSEKENPELPPIADQWRGPYATPSPLRLSFSFDPRQPPEPGEVECRLHRRVWPGSAGQAPACPYLRRTDSVPIDRRSKRMLVGDGMPMRMHQQRSQTAFAARTTRLGWYMYLRWVWHLHELLARGKQRRTKWQAQMVLKQKVLPPQASLPRL